MRDGQHARRHIVVRGENRAGPAGQIEQIIGGAHPAFKIERTVADQRWIERDPDPVKRPAITVKTIERAHVVGMALDEPDPALVCDGAFDFESGVRAANYLLDLPGRPSAIFASNDDMAAGVLAVAHDRNIDLPGELSVAGFDDTTLARTVWPPLTTVHQPMAELARTATEILIAGGVINHRRLPHTLIERASVAPPARTFP